MAFESEGDSIWLVGEGTPALGGSEYLSHVHGRVEGPPPAPDWKIEKSAGATVREAMRTGLARSAHDVSDGGLAIALAECALARRPKALGVSVRIPAAQRRDVALFGESHGRYLVTVKPQDDGKLEALAKAHGAQAARLGATGGDRFVIAGLIDEPLDELEKAWRAFPW
jgi:phosphoribosylformylglycinamidine synthase